MSSLRSGSDWPSLFCASKKRDASVLRNQTAPGSADPHDRRSYWLFSSTPRVRRCWLWAAPIALWAACLTLAGLQLGDTGRVRNVNAMRAFLQVSRGCIRGTRFSWTIGEAAAHGRLLPDRNARGLASLAHPATSQGAIRSRLSPSLRVAYSPSYAHHARFLQTGSVSVKPNSAPHHVAFDTDGTVVYNAPRRLHAFAVSGVALLQTGVWGAIAYSTSITPDPLLSPLWTLGGAGLSTLFVGMVHAYLSRSVAALSVHGTDAGAVHVVTYGIGGFRRAPRVLSTDRLVGGPKGADDEERHWTFGDKASSDSGATYFIVDRNRGVVDDSAVRAICSTSYGGNSLRVLAHKRQALEMTERWQDWRRRKN